MRPRTVTLWGRGLWLWGIACASVGAWSCSGDNFGVSVPTRSEAAAGDGGEHEGAGAAPADGSNVAGMTEDDGGSSSFGGGGSAGGAGSPATAGEGVGGEAALALKVLSTTPGDGASAIERDQKVEVTFSVNLDPETVTDQTFSVEGPQGAVPGQLAVEGAVATFTPDAAWALLTDYEVTLAPRIQSDEGESLAGEQRFSFATRDGVFRKPQRLTATKAVNNDVSGSVDGRVAVFWGDDTTPSSTFVTVFDPIAQKWAQPIPLEADNTNAFSWTSLDFNRSGQAFALTSGVNVAAWNRFQDRAWRSPSTSGVAEPRSVALADNGLAMTTWDDIVDNEWQVFAQSQSSAGVWSSVISLASGARTRDVSRYGAGFIAFFNMEAENALYSRTFDPKTGWAKAKRVTPVAASPNYIGRDANDDHALVTWAGAGGVSKAAVFDGASWVVHDLGGGGPTTARVGIVGDLAGWVSQKNAYVSRHDSTNGWGDAVKLGATTAEDIGVALEIDRSGNALAAWPEGSNISWRRASHFSSGWAEPQQIEDQDPFFVHTTSDDAGNVMLVWQNPLGVWASRFE
jgi:hypothetical protein